MSANESEIELLKRIAAVEDEADPEDLIAKLGWRSRDVGIWPGTLTKLRMAGYLEDIYESNSYHGYRLTPLARAMIDGAANPATSPNGESLNITEEIFSDIIGHEEVKELLAGCLTTEKPVHVLLTGPPALAKSLFLWDIERAGGESVVWLVGSAISKAGLWDMVADRRPKVLLVDELDKVNAADTAALLSIMEGGRMVRAKKGRELNAHVDTRVVAATNVENRLSPELRSRFAIRRLGAYGRDDFRQVITGVMVRHEGISSVSAEKIADLLDGRTQDVRDAVRVARLSTRLGLERAARLLLPDRGRGGVEGPK